MGQNLDQMFKEIKDYIKDQQNFVLNCENPILNNMRVPNSEQFSGLEKLFFLMLVLFRNDIQVMGNQFYEETDGVVKVIIKL